MAQRNPRLPNQKSSLTTIMQLQTSHVSLIFYSFVLNENVCSEGKRVQIDLRCFFKKNLKTHTKKIQPVLPGYLDFPGVHLSPGENQLLISFINPLYLYRHTPALRNLTTSRGLRYHVTIEFTCLPKSYTCESGVSFPEELEEYCITLSGNIELIPVRKTNPVCYRGRLMPIIVFSAMGCAVLFLHFFLLMKFKKKSLAKFPKFLENTLMKHTNTLKIETEPVVTNPKVEPDVAISLQYDSPEISALLRLLANSTQPSDNSSSLTSEENMGMDSGSGDPDENYSREAASSLSLAYDCPHRLVEMSTGDVVDAYGPRSHYRQ
uniref:Interferon/interleukin receptor domain-containing protein n=1 Tax=Electrophorus electricus TaxID=8005 RepID=A0A4W4GE40_ELEEL